MGAAGIELWSYRVAMTLAANGRRCPANYWDSITPGERNAHFRAGLILGAIVSSVIEGVMRIFKTRGVGRFTRDEKISDASLKAAIERADRGSIDASLGGGLIKQRIARRGQGRSGGYRMIIAYLAENRAVFLYGFGKNERDNISGDELLTLRTIGKIWLLAPSGKVSQALRDGDLQEINDDEGKD